MYIYMILNWKDQYIERKMMLRETKAKLTVL